MKKPLGKPALEKKENLTGKSKKGVKSRKMYTRKAVK